ncbi:salicylate 1-hydroxylase-like protein [Plenodomus tracheiphilus IPT5]|uniref:Salicylate 1-hydroxylase-like protein n=1 Tax=Plenodomus tracheiphilus IPT5 TaxID=1408161 RepID=A0A6A7ASB3_9PLEO|nr:salicylate 1-hydroxylase-like protein [Plenodomus tracheiphilus IPT5]
MSYSYSDPKRPLDLAIVGGGIAGLTLAIALLAHAPTLPVTLYESASAFGEIGAGVGFEPVMVRTMRLIDPRIAAAFIKCSQGNTPTGPPIWMRMRVGDQRKVVGNLKEGVVLETVDKGNLRLDEEIFHIPSRRGGPRGGVHRAHFLGELVKLIPDGVAHFRKKLIEITETKDGSGDAVLHFADGTSATHSAVLGCDGIKSKTRAAVLGDSNATAAVFSGKYAYRGLVPMDKAVEIMGPTVPKTAQMYLGYHGHLLTFPIANGTIMNVVAFSSRSEWVSRDWVVQTSREDMREDFKHWGPTVRSVMENLQKPDIWALFNHPPAPTYYRTSPLICLVGDAAHASTPHQGAGAGMCIEDSYILSQLLSKCRSKGDMEKAFAAYDLVRRPRSQMLVQTSREAGMLWDFEGEGVGDDLNALQQNAQERMAWIWDYDISEDLSVARRAMADCK